MLNNIEKNNPFRVPENYFQNFTNEMMAQLPEKENQKKVIPFWKSKSKWVAVAAALFGVAFLGVSYLEKNTVATNKPQQEMLSGEQLASIQNDYYLFVEDEVSQSAYYDTFYSEQF